MGWVLGLTGGIGSGKSAVAERFAARGARVIDTARIAHALTAAGGAAMPALRAAIIAGQEKRKLRYTIDGIAGRYLALYEEAL